MKFRVIYQSRLPKNWSKKPKVCFVGFDIEAAREAAALVLEGAKKIERLPIIVIQRRNILDGSWSAVR